ncbi:MAG: DUF3467 domain-containing protein [bacterium]|nr:DUF3467 domain-containing protein [bacterium]
MNGQQQNQVQIRASDKDLKGVYSNMMQVSHTQEEFILDFFSINPTVPVGVLASRVILSPGHMKRIIAALQENLKRYEGSFGIVTPAQGPGKEIGFKV